MKIERVGTVAGLDVAMTDRGTVVLYPRSVTGCLFTATEVRKVGEYLLDIADEAERKFKEPPISEPKKRRRRRAKNKSTSDVHADSSSRSSSVNVLKRKRRRRTRSRS